MLNVRWCPLSVRVLSSFVLMLVAGSSLANAQLFRNPLRIPTPGDPSIVMVADLNGDGIPDILYGNVSTVPREIDVLLGQKGGGYLPGKPVLLPQRSTSFLFCQAADINRDSNIDLICVDAIDTFDFTVLTWLGNGDGTFQPPISTATLTDPNGIYAIWLSKPADFNGDKNPDLVVDIFDESWYGNGSTLFFLLGDGAGNFSLKSTLNPPSTPGVFDFTTADVNGDGKPDLLGPIGPWVFLGNGDGTFQPGQPQSSFAYCLFHDMDGDGHLDALCGADLTDNGIGGGTVTGATELAILHGNPNGTFNPTPTYTKTFGNPIGGEAEFWYPLLLADVNGDGLPDLLAFSADGLAVLPGQTGPAFGDPVADYSVGFLAATSAQATAFADMNGDGVLDVVCVGPNGIYISYGKSDGTFAAPASFPSGQLVEYATAADFNGDGIPDLVAVGNNVLTLSLGKGDGTFQPDTPIDGGPVQFPYSPILHGDFFGSGKQDLLAFGETSQNDGYYLLQSNGDGTFAAPQLLSSVPLPTYLDTPIVIADINGDGRDDIAYTSNQTTNDGQTNQQTITVSLSNGDGTFTAVNSPVPGSNNVPSSTNLAFADFNRDGKLDAVYGGNGLLHVVAGHGDGTFASGSTTLYLPFVQGQSPGAVAWVAAADFDGDGNPDIAAIETFAYSPTIPNGPQNPMTAVIICYGKGDGTFSAPAIAATSLEPYTAIYASDVNQDGRPDLVLVGAANLPLSYATSGGNSIGVYLNAGNRFFAPEQNYTGGIAVQTPMPIVDLNGDGYPDLLAVGMAEGNGVTPLLNLGPTPPNTGIATTTTLTTSKSTVAAGATVTFTATVATTATGEPTPTGSVRFVDQTGVSFTAALTPVNATTAVATFTTSSIGIGQDTMGAFYSGDSVFAPSSASVAEAVSGLAATVSLTASPNPADAQQNVTFNLTVSDSSGGSAPVPAGVVVLSDGANPLFNPISLSAGTASDQTSFLYPGIHHLRAVYSGDAVHAAATGSVNLTILATPVVIITFSSQDILINQADTATVTVQQEVGPVPTGSVVLAGAGFTSAAVALTNGSATIDIPAGALPIGTDSFTATYTPDAASSSTYLSANSSLGINVSPIPPSFSLSSGSITIAAGATTGNTSTITITPANGFTGAINLSCSLTSSPTGAAYPPTCSVPNSVTVSGTTAATATLTVGTTAPGDAALHLPHVFGKGGAVLALLLCFGIPARRRAWRALLAVLAALLVASSLTACGGGSGGGGGGGQTFPGTTAGSYVITVNAADVATGTIKASTTVALTVN